MKSGESQSCSDSETRPDRFLREAPVVVAFLGGHRFDDRLGAAGVAGERRQRAMLADWERELRTSEPGAGRSMRALTIP